MPRLMRLHMASIGHKDARLAPVTLDFRHEEAGSVGSGADSVLWLRNGGGKSTIINLFYSVFRPNRREFLGASAEGKARRIDDYVKANDLAFVLSEWDVSPAKDAATLAGHAPEHVRLVGQAMAWKGQRRSSDPSDLRRLFFSLRAVPGELQFEDMPVAGLGDPVESLDAFRAWLRDMTARHPALEIVETAHHSRWNSHLDKIGLDTELFRYQLAMNQREGAADEVFRFTSSQAFVDFLLQLTFDVDIANQLAKNLEAQRERLRERPTLQAEQDFVARVLEALSELLGALRAEGRSAEALDGAVRELAALVGGLEARAKQLTQARDTQELAKRSAAEAARIASNQREKSRRWVRGLQRRVLELQCRDAKRKYEDATELAQAARHELSEARAAGVLREVEGLQAQVEAWRAELERTERALQPTRDELATRGGRLRASLRRASTSATSEGERQGREIARLRVEAAATDETRSQAERRTGALAQEVADLDRQITRRDQARERLLSNGFIDAREPADAAAARWAERKSSLEQQLLLRRAREAELVEELGTVRARAVELNRDDAALASRASEQETRIEAARTWRDRLMTDERLVEVEEIDEPSLETPGLVERLRQRSDSARQRLLRSRVDAAEDERAISAVDRDGLLPGPRDVDDVVARLTLAKVNAHTGLSYLAENLPVADRLAQIESDPGRYAGVLVVADSDAAARAALRGATTMHVPVQVCVVDKRDAQSTRTTARPLLVAPERGTFDRTAAAERRNELQEASLRRREDEAEISAEERAFDGLASDVRRFLSEHGGGKLQALVEAYAVLLAERDRVRHELSDLTARHQEHEAELAAVRERMQSLAASIQEAANAVDALTSFIDEHERQLDAARQRKQAAQAERRDADRTIAEATEASQRLQVLATDARDRQRNSEASAAQLRRECEAVTYFDDNDNDDNDNDNDEDADDAGEGDLARARTAYETLRQSYEKDIGENQAKWELQHATDGLAGARERYDRLAEGHDVAAIRGWLDQADLLTVTDRLERDHNQALQKEGIARNALDTASRELTEAGRQLRREAADLPPDGASIETVSAARALMQRYDDEAERHAEAQRGAEKAEQTAGEAARVAQAASREHESLASTLRARAQGSDVVLDAVPAVAITEDLERAKVQVRGAAEELDRTRRELDRATRGCRGHLDAVRSIANATRFADLKLQYRERLKADDDELRRRASELHERLDVRVAVIARELEQFDKDRRILVQELLSLGDDADRLLRRASHASTLPPELGAWGGRPYLRLRHEFPATDDERRARLEPFVDRIVQEGSIPGGLDLVRRAVKELAGGRGFDVAILKPDAILRPDPVPIASMVSFSRGQQLTAAILLYCTLVQLRAQSRGKGRGVRDAGVLILDNPIGTCSSVPLLELQRTIANQMRVQLIYATGVEDLEALAVMPNTIRLRNTHRDVRTGDHHVTIDGARVEEVRVVERHRP